jgi:D-alanine transaminase
MSRVAYVNGRYQPLSQPAVPPEDRGLQFADAVYEVVLVYRGQLIDEAYHLDRLERSLAELAIPMPMSRAALGVVARETIRRNRIRDGIVYLQISRGTAPRVAAPFPDGIAPNVILTARRVAPPDPEASVDGIGVKTVPDIRWGRRDIKTTALLPNAWAKQQAIDAGFKDAWQVDADGFVTEGSASNAWIVTRDKQLVTRPRSNDILWGVTRRRVIELAAELGLAFVERPFTVAEAKAASEAFLTSASSYVMPVTRIDETSIGNGRAGSVTMALAERYHAHLRGDAE